MEPHGAQVQKQIEKMENSKKAFSIDTVFSRDINKSLPARFEFSMKFCIY